MNRVRRRRVGWEGGLKKMSKKGQKNETKIFFVLAKYQSMTHVSTSIFEGLFKNNVFRSVVTKKIWAILDFFFKDRTFLRCFVLQKIL